MEQLQDAWKIVHENFMVFCNAFVGFNNSIYTISVLDRPRLTDTPIQQKMPVSERYRH